MHKIPMFVESGFVLKLGIQLSADILIRKGTTGMIICWYDQQNSLDG